MLYYNINNNLLTKGITSMKTFQLIHVTEELGAQSIIITEKEMIMDPTIPYEEIEAAMAMEIGEKMLIHYGEHPVKTGNLIRKEDETE
jgi:hypothetical protein